MTQYLQISPTFTTAIAHYQAGNFTAAESTCHQILHQQPSHVEALNLLGVIAYLTNHLEIAIAYYQKILVIKPNSAEAHNNLANILQQHGDVEDAIQCYQRAISLNPNYPEAHNNLGNVFQEQGNLDAAIFAYQQAILLNPNYPEAYNNLGNALHTQPAAAIDAYRQAILLNPDYAEAYNNLGCTLREQCDVTEAIACFDQALELIPDYSSARWNRALSLLISGDLQRGFAEYEMRSQIRNIYYTRPDAFTQPLWDGSDLEGRRILLHAEVGFGDTIQFIRYAALVKQRGGYTILACPKSLCRLFTTVPGVDHLIEAGTDLPAFDVHSPVLSLPHWFGTTLNTIPAPISYLAPPIAAEILEIPFATHLTIGIVWASGSRERSGIPDQRDCLLSQFIQLLSISGTRLCSLQVGQSASELDAFRGEDRVQDLSNQIRDFADTAALIAQLDLVISIDTAVAHLAGALGKPVWVLLPFAPDWRWLLEREDSPWYPSMRLFRQTQPGDWNGVFDRVSAQLHEEIKE